MKRPNLPATTAPKQAGRWTKGTSGNPAGRPKGARHQALVALDLVGHQAAVDLMRTVVKAAIEGDMRAADLLLARLWPVRRGRPVAIPLPKVRSAADLPRALAAITAAMAEGDLTPEEAASVAAVLDTQRQVIELHDIEARLTRLERSSHAAAHRPTPRKT